MAASFRNAGEIRELAGCDNITIAPALLAELEASTEPLHRHLSPDNSASTTIKMVDVTEEQVMGIDWPMVHLCDRSFQGFCL